MDWNAIIIALAWIGFSISMFAIMVSLFTWFFLMNTWERQMRNLTLGKYYIIVIISSVILYYG